MARNPLFLLSVSCTLGKMDHWWTESVKPWSTSWIQPARLWIAADQHPSEWRHCSQWVLCISWSFDHAGALSLSSYHHLEGYDVRLERGAQARSLLLS